MPADRFEPDAYLREETYTQTRAPVEYASTLIPEAYRSPVFFEAERQRVFSTGWVAVGHVSDIPVSGAVRTVTVAGQSVIVVRDRAGELRAFHNVCRHRASRLVTEQSCQLKRFRCPYHSWAYALDGTLLGAPLFEGSDIPDDQRAIFDTSRLPAFDKRNYGLLPVHVAAWANLVFVSLEPEPMPLTAWLGDLPERLAGYRLDEMTVVADRSYDIAANWKLIAENFMEYYHLPWVHPELVKVSRVEDHYRFQGPGLYTGMSTSPISRDTESGWTALTEAPHLADSDAVSGRFIWILPNLALSVLPNHVFTVLATPMAHDRTVERTTIALPPHTADDPSIAPALDELAAFWDHVNGEDIAIVERVQEGISSEAYTGGRMCFRFEEPLHRFQNMLIDRMVGLERIPAGDGDDPMFASPAADATGSQTAARSRSSAASRSSMSSMPVE
ncbi:MAG: aromatic ring-hydroxylating dioxygenase subunit alpha [Actinobacteria bacterium]|nr:aromatic ring-hydroxylating dioxygenase subunit alpha [Actinomycetota bacterium]